MSRCVADLGLGLRRLVLDQGLLQGVCLGELGRWTWWSVLLLPVCPDLSRSSAKGLTRTANGRGKHAIGAGLAGTGLAGRVGGRAPCSRWAPLCSPSRCSSHARVIRRMVKTPAKQAHRNWLRTLRNKGCRLALRRSGLHMRGLGRPLLGETRGWLLCSARRAHLAGGWILH